MSIDSSIGVKEQVRTSVEEALSLCAGELINGARPLAVAPDAIDLLKGFVRTTFENGLLHQDGLNWEEDKEEVLRMSYSMGAIAREIAAILKRGVIDRDAAHRAAVVVRDNCKLGAVETRGKYCAKVPDVLVKI
jgi:hypothetical protein